MQENLPLPPTPLQNGTKLQYIIYLHMMSWVRSLGLLGSQAQILGRHVSACATMLGYVRYYV